MVRAGNGSLGELAARSTGIGTGWCNNLLEVAFPWRRQEIELDQLKFRIAYGVLFKTGAHGVSNVRIYCHWPLIGGGA